MLVNYHNHGPNRGERVSIMVGKPSPVRRTAAVHDRGQAGFPCNYTPSGGVANLKKPTTRTQARGDSIRLVRSNERAKPRPYKDLTIQKTGDSSGFVYHPAFIESKPKFQADPFSATCHGGNIERALNPSWRLTVGSQPSSWRARVMSGLRTFGSSCGSGGPTSARGPDWTEPAGEFEDRDFVGLPELTGSWNSVPNSRTMPSTVADVTERASL